jgi:alginate O-acetyltransferase complex protein AlgI
MLTMLLGGLWHGASWNFLIWGGIHGGMLSFERRQGKNSFYSRLPRALRIFTTFFIVLLSWVFFRSADLPGAISYLGCMAGLVQPQPGAHLIGGVLYRPYYVFSFFLAAIAAWTFPTVWAWTQNITWPKVITCLVLLWISLILLLTQTYNPFIYFIF